MGTVQAIREGLVDPRHYGTELYKPVLWLHREISHTCRSIKNENNHFIEMVPKIARLVLVVFIPFALIPASLGLIYNFAAHFLNPLESIQSKIAKLQARFESVINVYQLDLNACESWLNDVAELKKLAIPAKYSQALQQLEQKLQAIMKLNQLNIHWNTIFAEEKLPGIQGDRGEALIARFMELKHEITPYRKADFTSTWFSRFTQVYEQFVGVIEQRFVLIQAPIRMNDDGQIPIPDKGNCFYEAVCRAFELYNVSQDPVKEATYRMDPKELRDKVIEWERDKHETDDLLNGYIEAAIDVLVRDKQREINEKEATKAVFLQEEEDVSIIQKEIDALREEIAPYLVPSSRINHYLEKASQEGFWAGISEFYAIAKMYDVSILVREKNRGVVKPLEQCMKFNEKAPKSMTIWWIDGHQFELWMEKLSTLPKAN